MKCAIYSRPQVKERDLHYFQELFDVLHHQQCQVLVLHDFYQAILPHLHLYQSYPTFQAPADLRAWRPDVLLCVGGDGTILEAATWVQDAPIPIAGINLGRLGFLAGLERERIAAAVQSLRSGSYWLDHRSLLHLESSPRLFEGNHFALNDFAILKRDTSSMIVVRAYLNGALLNTYWADGIILATPTGSTGYSLSCGGPIIFPNSHTFVLTPVAPHNLNVRPIILPDNSVVSFEVEGRADNFLCTLDSRYATVDATCQLAIRKADFTISLVQLNERTFLSTLRDKLAWGADPRN